MTASIAIEQSTDPEQRLAQRALAEALSCPVVTAAEVNQFAFVLRHELAGLTLQAMAKQAPGGLRVDFNSPALRRRAADRLRQQDLIKAIGVKGGSRPVVLDATAGLGSDAFLIAAAGCQVWMMERSAVVHALLADGLRRGVQPGSAVADIVARMHLEWGDVLDVALTRDRVDVVYLDPMFPAERKSARSGKGMYLLQALLGPAANEQELFRRARDLSPQRVVVKRGKRSPTIVEQAPDICFRGSSSRYDVYLLGS